jgi:hypothetical protein
VTNVLLNLPLYNAVIGALSLPNKTNKPLVLYISYGETDEWAYRFYRSYLDAAHQAHTWIKEIWDYVQMTLSIKTKLL